MTWLLMLLLIIFVLAPMAQAYARRLNPPDVPGVKPGEIARLREELELLAAQVNQLQDEQSFMLRLLTEGERKRPLLDEGEDDRGRQQKRRNPPLP
jgi:hypothetical protein